MVNRLLNFRFRAGDFRLEHPHALMKFISGQGVKILKPQEP